ncbi:MAG: hypothetical protein U0229_00200 [Anaeromyxobacter sp.]
MKLVTNSAAILGRTVRWAIVARNPEPPRDQVFLVFADESWVELYGNDIHCAGLAAGGGIACAFTSARVPGGERTVLPGTPFQLRLL